MSKIIRPEAGVINNMAGGPGYIKRTDLIESNGDIFNSGKFTGNLLGARDQSVQLRLVSDSDAYSMSKALVYYHHPGNWREPPNFWNPFWRVKLHPFTKQEVFQIEALAEQSLAAAVFATLEMTESANTSAGDKA